MSRHATGDRRNGDEQAEYPVKPETVMDLAPPTPSLRQVTAPLPAPLDEQYQTSLRNELQGNDVGAEAFWNAVQSIPCPYCDAKAGKPCMTSGGWPSVTYHRPRRNEAATEFRQAAR